MATTVHTLKPISPVSKPPKDVYKRQVHARLAAAKLGLVGDVVVDEGRGMKVLDGGRGAGRARHVTAHGATGREACLLYTSRCV